MSGAVWRRDRACLRQQWRRAARRRHRHYLRHPIKVLGLGGATAADPTASAPARTAPNCCGATAEPGFCGMGVEACPWSTVLRLTIARSMRRRAGSGKRPARDGAHTAGGMRACLRQRSVSRRGRRSWRKRPRSFRWSFHHALRGSTEDHQADGAPDVSCCNVTRACSMDGRWPTS